jgi:hypothetical protein
MLQKRSLILQNHTTLVHTALLHELAISANLRYQGGADIFVLDRDRISERSAADAALLW